MRIKSVFLPPQQQHRTVIHHVSSPQRVYRPGESKAHLIGKDYDERLTRDAVK